MTRVEFVERLVELTEGDYPVSFPLQYYGRERDNLKDYSREVYDNSFRLWKTKGTSSSFIIHNITYVRITDETDDTVSIRYLIMFNVWIMMVGSFLIGSIIYVSFSDPIFLLYGLGIYTLYLWGFNSDANEDKAFLRKLTNEMDIGN